MAQYCLPRVKFAPTDFSYLVPASVRPKVNCNLTRYVNKKETQKHDFSKM